MLSDSEIEDDLDDDLGIKIDFGKEEEKANLSFGELLGMWTNATDTTDIIIPEIFTDSDSDSDSGSESGSDTL
jgi:hypothetical protein